MDKHLTNIPTNIITGFLGVGKTTAILHLLEQKPEHERWAILVNEFGEIGIDGGIVAGKQSSDPGLFVREVPGGCMCCAAGLPMQIALTQLLHESRPDRLLIEPTGLGHPKEVMTVLQSDHYQEVLDIQQTITLIDARQLSDSRYAEHEIFQQQLSMADLIIANKVDQYQPEDHAFLQHYLAQDSDLNDKRLYSVTMGQIDLAWLSGVSDRQSEGSNSHLHHHHQSEPSELPPIPGEDDFPDCGFLSISNQGEGFVSRGWVFEPRHVFDYDRLYAWLTGLMVERAKGVFLTEKGAVAFNKVNELMTEISFDSVPASRIELIAADESLLLCEKDLLSCVLRKDIS